METTVRDSVAGIAQISILNTSYFWPDDVAGAGGGQAKSETVPYRHGFWPLRLIRPACICRRTRVLPFMAGRVGNIFWLSADNQIEIEAERDFWLPHFIWPGQNFQLTQVVVASSAAAGKTFFTLHDQVWRPEDQATLIAERDRICAVCVINTKLIKTSV